MNEIVNSAQTAEFWEHQRDNTAQEALEIQQSLNELAGDDEAAESKANLISGKVDELNGGTLFANNQNFQERLKDELKDASVHIAETTNKTEEVLNEIQMLKAKQDSLMVKANEYDALAREARRQTDMMKNKIKTLFAEEQTEVIENPFRLRDVVLMRGNLGLAIVRYVDDEIVGLEMSGPPPDEVTEADIKNAAEAFDCVFPGGYGIMAPTSAIKKKILPEQLLIKLQSAVQEQCRETTVEE